MSDAPAVHPEPLPVLTTERLVLRPFTLADAADVRRFAGERAIADTTLAIPHPYPEGAAERWIEGHAAGWADGTRVDHAITRRGEGSLIGAIGLAISPAHASAEMGYWIAVSLWGHGFASEAARALLAFAFGPLGLHRVHAHHLTRNPSSGRVMVKLGMRREGTLRDAVRKWGRFEDVEQYAILAAEWAALDAAR